MARLFTKIYHFTLKGSAQMKYTTLNGDTNKDKYSTTPPQPIWTYTYTKNTGDRVLLTLLQSFHHNHIYKCYLASSLCHELYERIVVIWWSNITISVKMWFVWSMSNSIKHDVDDGKGDNGDYLIFAWALATLVDLVSHFLKYWLPKFAWVIFVVNSHNQRYPSSENGF